MYWHFIGSSFWIVATLMAIIGIIYLTRNNGETTLIGLYSALIVIASVTATKIVTFFGFSVPAGVIVYASSFLITDLISEVYGKDSAIRAVRLGLFCMLLFLMYSFVTVKWSSAPFWQNQAAYESVIGLSIRVSIAGIVAFIISQSNDVIIFHYFKEKQQDSFPLALALRNCLSTATSQLIDTTIFITIAFYGTFEIIPLIIGQYCVKLIIAGMDTIFVYWGRHILTSKRQEASR